MAMEILAGMAFKRLAEVVITPSSARGLHPTKAEQTAIRNKLKAFQLDQLSAFADNPDGFTPWLDAHTASVRSVFFPRTKFEEAAHFGWGYARKFVNLFLAEAARNYMVRSHHKLDEVEALFEVPLDSHVAGALEQAARCGCVGNVHLPEWHYIYRLEPSANNKFQCFALAVAERQGCVRHNLDLMFWRRENASKCGICGSS